MVILPVDTADTAAASEYIPTMRRSIVPYKACRNKVPKIGTEKNSIFFNTLPSVKSCCIEIHSSK